MKKWTYAVRFEALGQIQQEKKDVVSGPGRKVEVVGVGVLCDKSLAAPFERINLNRHTVEERIFSELRVLHIVHESEDLGLRGCNKLTHTGRLHILSPRSSTVCRAVSLVRWIRLKTNPRDDFLIFLISLPCFIMPCLPGSRIKFQTTSVVAADDLPDHLPTSLLHLPEPIARLSCLELPQPFSLACSIQAHCLSYLSSADDG